MLVSTNIYHMSFKHVYEPPTVEVVGLQYEGVVCASQDNYGDEFVI